MTSITGKALKAQTGYTYVMALLAVALVGIASSVAYNSSRYGLLKAQEEELMFHGLAYYRAIESYYQATSPHVYPARLQDLIKDPRFIHRRHLRQLYAAPRGGEWSLLLDKQRRIIGVYFDNERRPIRRQGFIEPLQAFAEAKTYADWQFVYRPEPLLK